MANEHFKNALQQAGLQPDDLAELIEVDVKTVRRWLYGMRPYPRHRTRIARTLDRSEPELWPEPAAPAPEGSDPSHASRTPHANRDEGVGVEPDHLALIDAAQERIDVVAAWSDDFLFVPGVLDALNRKAAAGCQVRVIAVEFPDEEEEDFEPGFEFEELEIEQDFSIHRYDDQILITLRWIERGPQIHTLGIIPISASDPTGTFQQIAEHRDALWRHAYLPTRIAGLDDDPVDAEDHSDPAPALPPDQTPTPARHWPGRPPKQE